MIEPPRTVGHYRETGEALLKQGNPLQAYDTLADGLSQFPDDVRLRQLTALALARTGASRLASEILERLAVEGHADEETLGMLARTYKDLWADSPDPGERQRYLQLAFERYRDAHTLSNGYWSGINAATMAMLLGRRSEARQLARRVSERCAALRESLPDDENPYWLLATLGEASLLIGDRPQAERWYTEAAAAGRGRFGDLASTRRNARLIVQHLGADGASIEASLQVPRVVVCVGHLIDRPDRPAPRFPSALEADVRGAIRSWLAQAGAGFGYASAACGSDILFLESLPEVHAESHIVLPYNRDQFLEDSVDIVPGSDWAERYERALAAAVEVVTASEQRMAGSAVTFEYGFSVLDGLAALRADALDTELVCLAVWDGKQGDGPGGTDASVARWRKAGRRVHVIDLAALRERAGAIVAQPPAPNPAPGTAPAVQTPAVQGAAPAFDAQVVGLLFADARGFSRLNDEQIPLFVDHFLGTVAAELERSPAPPVVTNTWGDGLYLVFRTIRETGDFALRLCDTIRRMNWVGLGLPDNLNLRIGLHAGPAYACLDPVTRRLNYLGAHVSRAARIEPITPPGEVYASGAFAALARAEEIDDFLCAYVGQTPLAKGYGTSPTYVVHRRRIA